MIFAFSISLLLLAVAGLFLAAHVLQRRMYKALFIIVPIVLIAAGSTFFTISGAMGLPSGSMPKDVRMLDYHTNGKDIWVWAIPKGGNVPRTYVFDYSKAAHEELQRGKELNQKGGMSALKGKENGAGSDAPFVHHPIVPLKDLPPKDGEPGVRLPQ